MTFPRDPGSPSENGNGTQILCVSEVIGHPNHQLRIWLDVDAWGLDLAECIFCFLHTMKGAKYSWIKHSMKGWNFRDSIKHLPHVPIGEIYIYITSLKTNSKSTWKWMVGIFLFVSFWGQFRPIFRCKLAVSFRECTSWNLRNIVFFHLIYPGWLGKLKAPSGSTSGGFFILMPCPCLRRSLMRRFFIIHQRL